eukprot:4140616-Prymnesium_polylepis.1
MPVGRQERTGRCVCGDFRRAWPWREHPAMDHEIAYGYAHAQLEKKRSPVLRDSSREDTALDRHREKSEESEDLKCEDEILARK